MFKFLKIRTSDSGDALRHVPFTSIIHKHIFPLFLSLILILFSSTEKVYAVDVPLPPVWLPMNPYNSDALHNNYVLLNDDQKKIVKEVMGVYGSVFLGLAANPLQNPLDTVSNARNWLQEYGSSLLNAFFDSSVQAPRAMNDLIGSVTYKASQYESYNDYVADTDPTVSSGLEKYLQFTPELTVAYKNWFAVHGDVYDWQVHAQPFTYNWTWKTYYMSETYQNQYNNYLAQLNNPIHYNNIVSSSNDWYYNITGNLDPGLYQFNNLFFNTNSHNVYLVNSSGQTYFDVYNSYQFLISAYVAYGIYVNVEFRNNNQYLYVRYNSTVPYNSNASIASQVESIVNNNSMFYHSNTDNNALCPDLSAYINKVYAGTSWLDKQEVYNIDDLNIGASPSAYIDNVSDDAFVNINGLIGYLGSDVTDVREGVFDNTLVREGDHAIELTDSILKAIDRVVEETKSGISIPTDVFSSLFDDGKGFISYMWYMTKPLVIYTRDLLDLLTFDPINGFNASGPGYFILGVVGLGVIGGVVVKFLL